MSDKITRTKFINLLKQYWKSNPELSFQELWSLLIDQDLANDLCISHKISELVLDEEKAYNKLLNLCKEDDNIENYFKNIGG